MHSPVKLRTSTMRIDVAIDGFGKTWSPESPKKRYKTTAEQCARLTGISGHIQEKVT